MRLNQICDKVALRVLGKPETLVEAMKAMKASYQLLEEGKIYKVIGKECFGNNLYIEGMKFSLHPRRFRKAIEK